MLCFLYATERVSILYFIEKELLLRSSSQIPVTKPTGIASLVLHEGLLEAKIPPRHRLSLMQSCIDVILSLRQEDRICCCIKMNVLLGDHVAFQFICKFFKKIFKFIIRNKTTILFSPIIWRLNLLCFLMSLSVDASRESNVKSYAWAINRNLSIL